MKNGIILYKIANKIQNGISNERVIANEIVKGNKKLNSLFITSIFSAYSCLDPQSLQEKMNAAKLFEDAIEGQREEREYRMQIN